MKRKYIYIGVLVLNFGIAYFNYSNSTELNNENKKLSERNTELKQIAIQLNDQLRESATIRSGLLNKIDSLSKKDTVYIQKQYKNEKVFKKNIAVIDTVNVNELIRLFTN